MLALTISVIGVALFGFCRNVAIDVAIESARWSALADQPIAAGCELAKRELAATLAASLPSRVSCDEMFTSKGRVMVVEILIDFPSLGLLSAKAPIKAVGHAFAEIQG